MRQLKGDYTGYSQKGLQEAIQDALAKVESFSHFEVVETKSTQQDEKSRLYQVIITAFFN
ncbi:MAG: dodecin domain-containing protein [Proteobacteria bacterium]|nr:dodecin domain-containing protein [Pseudomonadota bacterium]